MIHLSTKKGAGSPPLVVDEQLTIEPITTAPKADQHPALRWLGVWFDRKLKFRRHVQERVTKARKVAHHIRQLGKTKDGPPASSLHKAVTTCVLSSVLYGSEVWYAGKSRVAGYRRDGTAKWVSNRLGGLIGMVGSAIVLAARGVLPVWRTTPLTVLHRDSGLPSAEVALEEAKSRLAYRLKAVDKDHPLARRTAPTGRKAVTKLQRVNILVPDFPRPVLREPHYYPGCRRDPTDGKSKNWLLPISRFGGRPWWPYLPAMYLSSPMVRRDTSGDSAE